MTKRVACHTITPMHISPFRPATVLARMAVACLGLALALPASAFDLQAHRGGRGLMPENTLAAFENALRLGVTTLELDIAITADGIAVISHEPVLYGGTTRGPDGAWLTAPGPVVRNLTLAEVQRYDVGRLNPALAYGKPFADTQQSRDGERIPTLASLFDLVKRLGANDVQFDIETKIRPDRPAETLGPDAFVPILLGVIRDAGMTRRVMIQSFDWRSLALVHRLEPGMRTMYLTIKTQRTDNTADPAWTNGMVRRDHASVPAMVKAAGGTIWAPNFASLDADGVKLAQSLGLQCIPWTVNDPADMRRLIGWGVDGIITDYPDRLREAMRESGLPLPAAVPR